MVHSGREADDADFVARTEEEEFDDNGFDDRASLIIPDHVDLVDDDQLELGCVVLFDCDVEEGVDFFVGADGDRSSAEIWTSDVLVKWSDLVFWES